jgi:hypothetical protein
VPLQQLFVLNSEFMVRNAKALVEKIVGKEDSEKPDSYADQIARVRQAYRLLFAREASEREVERAVAFLGAESEGSEGQNKLTRWEQLAQALLSSNEFMFVD